MFLDIQDTSHLFGGEEHLLTEALKFSRDFFPEARGAIADSPAAAQVFSSRYSTFISRPTHEFEDLGQLPLAALNQLEGLMAWKSSHEIDEIVEFFTTLGFHQISSIRRFDVESFRERWGPTGSLLWKRLNGLDKQVISPLLPSEPVTDYIYLDFPVSLLSFLLHLVEKSLTRMFARLQGRGEFAQKILLHLYCEYSENYHLVELIPASPSRDLELYLKLIENRLARLDLANPVKEFEIEIVSCPEREEQMDFWKPRITDREKLEKLISVFRQNEITTGYLKPRDEILPENSWELIPEFEEYQPLNDSISVEGQAFQVKPAYSHSLSNAPRPNQILRSPKPLSAFEVKRLEFLSTHPIERIEDAWWQDSRGRDYYFAISPQGQCLWVFYDRIEHRYYLHGYFD